MDGGPGSHPARSYDRSRTDAGVFDWQGYSAGRSIFDISYLLGAFYTPQFRRSIERAAIERFVEGVHRGGVIDYSLDQAWMDYELGMLLALQLPPFFSQLDTSTSVGGALAEKCMRNLSIAAMDLGGHAWLDRLEARALAQSA